MAKFSHQPVLLTETLQIFEGQNLHIFVDATLGAGGHAEALLAAHPEMQLLMGIDQDQKALDLAAKRLAPWKDKIRLFHGNFVHLPHYLKEAGVSEIDGLLADFGVSSMQFDDPARGFSLMREGPLDMRMNVEEGLTAKEIVNVWPEKELCRIFRDFGEEKKWRQAARTIAQVRQNQPIETTLELVAILEPILREPVWKRKSHIHPLTKVFQALRIAVNRELERIEEFLRCGLHALRVGGKMAVISFHSLEDRIAKQFFQEAASDKVSTSGIAGVFLGKRRELKLITKKPLTAGEAEILSNPRSRSAKLRAVERL